MSRMSFWCAVLTFLIALVYAFRQDWLWAYYAMFVAYINLEFSDYWAAEE